jgi:hypothetical protein
MPEEIFQKCAYCGRVFNYEWGGWRLNGKYVCSNEECQKKMQQEKNAK